MNENLAVASPFPKVHSHNPVSAEGELSTLRNGLWVRATLGVLALVESFKVGQGYVAFGSYCIPVNRQD